MTPDGIGAAPGSHQFPASPNGGAPNSLTLTAVQRAKPGGYPGKGSGAAELAMPTGGQARRAVRRLPAPALPDPVFALPLARPPALPRPNSRASEERFLA